MIWFLEDHKAIYNFRNFVSATRSKPVLCQSSIAMNWWETPIKMIDSGSFWLAIGGFWLPFVESPQMRTRAQHLFWFCTHTHTTHINIDLCPPMPTHSITCAHSCYSNCAHVFKICNITNNITNTIAPMPTQNPWAWAWAWAPNVGLCWEPSSWRPKSFIYAFTHREW